MKKFMDPGLILAIISACVKVCGWIFNVVIALINRKKK